MQCAGMAVAPRVSCCRSIDDATLAGAVDDATLAGAVNDRDLLFSGSVHGVP